MANFENQITLDIYIVSPGGVGCTYLINYLTNETGLLVNDWNDDDRIKHLSSPFLMPKNINIKKAIYLFNDPLLSIKSHFKRKFIHAQVKKLGFRKLETKGLKYKDYIEKICKSKTDLFGLEFHFNNWVNSKRNFDILFLDFNSIIKSKKLICDYLGINLKILDDIKIIERSSKLENEIEDYKLIYKEIYNHMKLFDGKILKKDKISLINRLGFKFRYNLRKLVY